MISKSTRTLFSLATLTLALSASALAQSADGVLRGTVLDPSGALIPQAQITVSNADGFTRTLTSDPNGAFEVSHLAPGGYSISINANGFTPALDSIQVEGNKVANEDIKLGISVLQEIEVDAN
jgi:hypothetical protein